MNDVQAVLVAAVLQGDISSTFNKDGGNKRTQTCRSQNAARRHRNTQLTINLV